MTIPIWESLERGMRGVVVDFGMEFWGGKWKLYDGLKKNWHLMK